MLLHMACMALRRGNMTVTVIDLGTVERSNCSTDKVLPDVTDADLVLIDNADRSPLASHQTDWWAKFAQRLPKSACVLVAMTPDTFGSANEPWRAHSGDWRDTKSAAPGSSGKGVGSVASCLTHSHKIATAQ